MILDVAMILNVALGILLVPVLLVLLWFVVVAVGAILFAVVQMLAPYKSPEENYSSSSSG